MEQIVLLFVRRRNSVSLFGRDFFMIVTVILSVLFSRYTYVSSCGRWVERHSSNTSRYSSHVPRNTFLREWQFRDMIPEIDSLPLRRCGVLRIFYEKSLHRYLFTWKSLRSFAQLLSRSTSIWIAGIPKKFLFGCNNGSLIRPKHCSPSQRRRCTWTTSWATRHETARRRMAINGDTRPTYDTYLHVSCLPSISRLIKFTFTLLVLKKHECTESSTLRNNPKGR